MSTRVLRSAPDAAAPDGRAVFHHAEALAAIGAGNGAGASTAIAADFIIERGGLPAGDE